jgi:hypothetical protein
MTSSDWGLIYQIRRENSLHVILRRGSITRQHLFLASNRQLEMRGGKQICQKSVASRVNSTPTDHLPCCPGLT